MLQLKVNGVVREVNFADPSNSISERSTLLDYLHSINFGGTKYGCGEGGCGACTVHMEDGDSTVTINSCLRPLATCHGKVITTVEGLANDCEKPLPTSSVSGNQSLPVNSVAYAIAKNAGSQCGYCSAGFTMTLAAAKKAKCLDCPTPNEPCDVDIEDLYSGHLCRCTGYRGLRVAAKEVLVPQEYDKSAEHVNTPDGVMDVASLNYSDGSLKNPNVKVINIDAGRPQVPQPHAIQPTILGMHEMSELDDDSEVIRDNNEMANEEPPEQFQHNLADMNHWHHPTQVVEVQNFVANAVEKQQKYKLVYGNTSSGVYKDGEWTDIDVFIDMNMLQASTVPALDDTCKVLSIPTACSINGLKHFLKGLQFVETDAILSLLVRVAGNQVRNVGTVGGSVAMAFKWGFLSDTFLGLAICKTNVTYDKYDVDTRTWSTKTEPLWAVYSARPRHFILRDFQVPLNSINAELNEFHAGSISHFKFMRCYKVARRLQNSHSLINFASSVVYNGEEADVQIIVGNIGARYTALKSTEAQIAFEINHFNEHTTVGAAFDRIEKVARTELNQFVVSNEEFDPLQTRVSLAANCLRKFLIALFGQHLEVPLAVNCLGWLCGKKLKKSNTSECNIYDQRMLMDAHGAQKFRVDKAETPTSEPMIKTTAVQQAMGQTEYISLLPMPEGTVHATFVLSSFSTGQLIWDEEKISQLPELLSSHIKIKFHISIEPTSIHLFRASDVGESNVIAAAPESAPNSFKELLLADLEAVYCGQAIAIIVSPFQWASNYIAHLLEDIGQVRATDDSSHDMCIVRFVDTYEPILDISDARTTVPVLSRNQDTNEIVSSVVDRKLYDGYGLLWVSNLPNPANGAPPTVDFDQFQNDRHIILEGTHEVGSQAHFYLETQSALAYAPVVINPDSTHSNTPCDTNAACPQAGNDTHPWVTAFHSVASCHNGAYVHRPPRKEESPPQKSMILHAATQSPNGLAETCTHLLNKKIKINMKVPSVGGGFGGKTNCQGKYAPLAAAFVASKLNCACRVILDRVTDMRMIGKRHPFSGKYKVAACVETGKIVAASVMLLSDAGVNYDCSLVVKNVAILNAFHGYDIPQFICRGDCLFTNKASNTSTRSFGVIQSNQICEVAVNHVCKVLNARHGLNPFNIRLANFYPWLPYDTAVQDLPTTPYGQKIVGSNLVGIWKSLSFRLLQRNGYSDEHNLQRVRVDPSVGFKYMSERVADFNSKNEYRKQGFYCVPLMYGVSFNTQGSDFDKMTSHIVIDQETCDVHIHTTAVEIGNGLLTRLMQIAATCFGIPAENIKVHTVMVEYLPDAIGTGSSTTQDLHGFAIKNQTDVASEFMGAVKAALGEDFEKYYKQYGTNTSVVPSSSYVQLNDPSEWPTVCAKLKKYLHDNDLSNEFDALYDTNHLLTLINEQYKDGAPYYYYIYAAAMSHVEVDCLTGEFNLLATDLIYDAGVSINPTLDIGQIEGGFIQGLGFVSCEEINYASGAAGGSNISTDPAKRIGDLVTDSTWTYKPPTTTEIPIDWNVYLYPCDQNDISLLPTTEGGGESYDPKKSTLTEKDLIDTFGIQSSKNTGEPPLVLGNAVYFALQDAVDNFRASKRGFGIALSDDKLKCPATTYAIVEALAATNIR